MHRPLGRNVVCGLCLSLPRRDNRIAPAADF
jgi:hypothetical protein